MVCSSSFDGHVSVFSLMGGGASGQDFHQQQVSGFKLWQNSKQANMTTLPCHLLPFSVAVFCLKQVYLVHYYFTFTCSKAITTVLWNGGSLYGKFFIFIMEILHIWQAGMAQWWECLLPTNVAAFESWT